MSSSTAGGLNPQSARIRHRIRPARRHRALSQHCWTRRQHWFVLEDRWGPRDINKVGSDRRFVPAGARSRQPDWVRSKNTFVRRPAPKQVPEKWPHLSPPAFQEPPRAVCFHRREYWSKGQTRAACAARPPELFRYATLRAANRRFVRTTRDRIGFVFQNAPQAARLHGRPPAPEAPPRSRLPYQSSTTTA